MEVGVTHRLVGQLRGVGQEVGVIFVPTFFLLDHAAIRRVLLCPCQHQSDNPQRADDAAAGAAPGEGRPQPKPWECAEGLCLTSCHLWAFPGRSGEFCSPSGSGVLLKEGAACLSDQQLRHDAGRADGRRHSAFRSPIPPGNQGPHCSVALRACFCGLIGLFWSLASAVNVEGRGYPAVRAASPELAISLCLPLGAGCR